MWRALHVHRHDDLVPLALTTQETNAVRVVSAPDAPPVPPPAFTFNSSGFPHCLIRQARASRFPRLRLLQP